MTVNVRQLAAQIYVQAVVPCITGKTVQGPGLDMLFREAATNSIAAAEEFAHCYDKQATLPAVPVA